MSADPEERLLAPHGPRTGCPPARGIMAAWQPSFSLVRGPFHVSPSPAASPTRRIKAQATRFEPRGVFTTALAKLGDRPPRAWPVAAWCVLEAAREGCPP